MNKFTLEIAMTGADIKTPADVAMLLAAKAELIGQAEADETRALLDANGNTVGSWAFTGMRADLNEFYKDILITAVEGGINYWSQVSDYDPDNGTVKVYELPEDPDTEEAVAVEVTVETIANGLALATSFTDDFAARVKTAVAEQDAGDIDSLDADCILQLGMFGKQVYA